jgi:hypothetical protein
METFRAAAIHARAARDMDARRPVVAGARLGRDPDGHPAWYVADPRRAGKFLKVGT